MLHKKYVNRGFTLVELLSVIVILAIILVIAVPKIMSVITDSKKSSLETSAKMIASTAEKTKVQKELLGEEITGEVDCSEFTKVTSDYESCTVKFDGNTAKVNITGANKFEGMYICNADKNNATAQTNECINAVSFATDSWETIVAAVQSGDYPYQVGDTKEVELTGFTNDEEGSNGLYTLRIANTTPCSKVEVESQTACGFVLEFADIITYHKMNSTATNEGGWPASEMRIYVNDTIYNSLPTELQSAIIDTKVISNHGSGDSNPSRTDGYFESIDKLYLLSIGEMYSNYSEETITRQLDYYYNLGTSESNSSAASKSDKYGSPVPLRSAYGNDSFRVYESYSGYPCYNDESYYLANKFTYFSSAFRLAE